MNINISDSIVPIYVDNLLGHVPHFPLGVYTYLSLGWYPHSSLGQVPQFPLGHIPQRKGLLIL